MSAPDVSAVETSGTSRFVCFLCKRKFKSGSLLARHKQLSELHSRNAAKLSEDILGRKQEHRQAVAGLKRQMQDNRHSSYRPMHEERAALERKLRAALAEYCQSQERLEVHRLLQQAERAGLAGDPTAGPWPPRHCEVHESSVGKLIMSAGAASWQGNKNVQEDRYILDIALKCGDGGDVAGFCVLDGHSGRLCVDYLQEALPRNLRTCLGAKPTLTEEHLRLAVQEACALTDSDFLAEARKREALDGSTMILCLVWAGGEGTAHRLLIANLGDSRAVLCRSTGNGFSAVRLSDDHKPSRMDERSRIEAMGGVVDVQGVWRVFTPGPANFGGRSVLWGLAVSRAFGDLLMKEPQSYGCAGALGELVSAVPEIHTYELRPAEDRFLVLACDGVWDVLSDEDAVATCVEHRSAASAARALVWRSFESGSDDNITALVLAWQLEDGRDSPPASQAARKVRRVD